MIMLMQQNPSSPSDYDFILNHNPAPKRSIIPGAGSSLKQRILFVVIGGGVLLILIVLVASLLSGAGKEKGQRLLQIAQAQNELIRVSTLGVTKATSSNARALAITTQLSMETAQKDVLSQMQKQGQNTNPTTLAATKDSKTDDALAAAAQNNRYDETFLQIMHTSLTDYQNLLKTAFDESSSKSMQTLLNNEYLGAGLLIDKSKT